MDKKHNNSYMITIITSWIVAIYLLYMGYSG